MENTEIPHWYFSIIVFTFGWTIGWVFIVLQKDHFAVKLKTPLLWIWLLHLTCILTASLAHMPLVECGSEITKAHFSTKIEVFPLDSSGPPSWVKVESLGEAALLIDDEHGSSLLFPNSSRQGGRSHCIYLAQWASDTWAMLPLDGKAITVYNPRSPFYWANYSLLKWSSPIWVYSSMLY